MSGVAVLLTDLLAVVVFLVSFRLDPRKFRTGLYLLFAVFCVGATIVGAVTGWASSLDETAGALAVPASGSLAGFTWLLLVGLPAGYLGFAFVAFLLYGALYPALMARQGGPVAAVVVLGSGLIDGEVPPLLASRLRKARQVFDGLVARGTPPRLLVTSGGRGPDEPVAEAEAMADFLVADGMPRGLLGVENRSQNTDENLGFTADLLASVGIGGPIAVVTSDFHAFRAALLMRRHRLDGYALGAPTAVHYWPSAVIREFFAVLRDHLWLNVVLLGLSLVPLLLAVAGVLTTQR